MKKLVVEAVATALRSSAVFRGSARARLRIKTNSPHFLLRFYPHVVARWLLQSPNVIRITNDSSKGSPLVVEGHLLASAVDVLRKSCAARGKGTVLDLSGLIFADRSGAELLNELIAEGFVIEGCSGFIRQLLLSNAGAKVA